ncbi:MAG: precorrin-6A reductase [Firmicutes bacterium]|nr:precorrin-6A reductase [Bacillota bacterium]
MYDLVLFGGTEEGRVLAEFLGTLPLSSCVCVATGYGSAMLPGLRCPQVRQGRMDEAEMGEFLLRAAPKLVLDATHPYASAVRENIRAVCSRLLLPCLRIVRPPQDLTGCRCFPSMPELVEYLNHDERQIFSTLGAKEMDALTAVHNFRERVSIRMLPSPEPLARCLALGYSQKRIICMQGPFSQELNRAMFRASGCEILVTKESGSIGGFPEKVRAAAELGMECCVLLRPAQEQGVSVAAAKQKILELCT